MQDRKRQKVIRLTIGNSLSRIEGLSATQWRQLRDVLSYNVKPDEAFFSSDTRLGRRYLLGRRGGFPTGLLYLVKKWLADHKLAHNKKDLRYAPLPPSKGPISRFEMQLPYSPYLEQVAAANAVKRVHRGVISAPTGFGKSAVIALIIEALQVKTLIVVPTLGLKRQLTEFLAAAFVGNTVGGLESQADIVIENIHALDPGKPLKGYDCVIVDEFHHSAADTYRQLNMKAWTGVYYRVGLTATPFRNNDNERLLLESFLSHIIYRVTHAEAVAKGYIVPIEAYYVDLPIQEMEGNITQWQAVYSELVVHNKVRNNTIALLLSKLVNQSALCLVKEVAHGEILADLTGLHFIKGANKDNKEALAIFNRGGHKAIATTGVMGEGVDTKPAEWILVAGAGKSRPAFMQLCGRGFRNFSCKQSCKVLLFKDKSHKYLLKHYNAQVKTLRDEYGIKPVKLELDNS